MREEKNTVCKSGPSNLLVGRTKSMFKLVTFVFSFVVKDEFPSQGRVGKQFMINFS